MNAIIVDDEKHVRDAVRLLVDWNRHGITQVFEASDGEQAIELISQEKPDLIFIDMMMPVKTGSELLEWIVIHSPLSKTIVISGHDDYKLVRHTLKHGCVDYLLKPIDADQLAETVQRALDSWYEEEQKRHRTAQQNIEVNQLKPVYWDKFFSSLVSDPSSIGTAMESLRVEFGLSASGHLCRAVVIGLDCIEPALAGKFGANRELLVFSLTNICNEFIRRNNTGYAFRYWNSDKEILILLWNGTDEIDALLNEMNSGMARTLGTRLHFGIGSAQPFPYGLSESYKEAKNAIRQRNLLDDWAYNHYINRQQSGSPIVRFNEHAEDLRMAVQSGNTDAIAKAVGQAISPLRKLQPLTVEQLELWWNEYTVYCSHLLQELVRDTEVDIELPDMIRPFGIPLDGAGKPSLEIWEDELNRAMRLVSKLLAEKRRKENNLVHEIAKFIQANYQNELTLQDIANHLYVGREYISRRFKQETGENVSDYIGRIRNEKAKLLLLNPNLKIAQIAEMVGYQDEKYFSKVFKKLTGMTPNEYRKAGVV
ncbi:response regulator [Gorillibacterium massiliense]|uniref:response regulator n=1 Tax=Gorillibacterium massiliense TaxID=1280390 RepID=UPI0004BAD0E0|nr:response regulator [Gorillibacterium massiliense]